jgi:general secretion pathway protein N
MMASKIVVRAIFLVVFFVFFLIYLAPANKLMSFVDLPKNVKLYNVSGDLWNGKIETIDIAESRITNVNWKINFFTLVFGRGLSVNIRDPELVRGSFDLNIFDLNKEIYLSKVELKSYISKILPFLKLPFPIKAEGVIQTNLRNISLNKNGTLKAVNGSIHFNDVMIQHPFDPSLMIDLGKINVSLENPNGDVNIVNIIIDQESEQFKCQNIKVIIKNMNNVQVSGSIRPKGSIPDSLISILNMIGKPDAEGNIRIDYKGSF